MLTLTVNTSSFTESVALFTREKVLDEIKWRGAFDETEKLLPTIMRLLKNSQKKIGDLKRIIVVNGPGPFSALRIGITVANILSFCLQIPIYSIDTQTLWRLRSPGKNAVLLLHAGGNFVAFGSNKISKITDVIDNLGKNAAPKTLYGDLTPDEYKHLQRLKNKTWRFISENKLTSVAETLFNVKLSLLKKAKKAAPKYWKPPNITSPK